MPKAPPGRIIVRRSVAPTTTKHGLVIPDTCVGEYECRGFVLMFGDDINMVEAEDEIVFQKGDKFVVDGLTYVAVHPDDVLFINNRD